MRLAIISDIHGNCFALDAVLADLGRYAIDQIVCLGDAIQSGPQPAETVERLRALACPVVMGNSDAWLLTGEETNPQEKFFPVTYQVREWSLQQLTPEDQAFIAGFQPTVEIALENGKRLLCFHGSPRSFHEVILPTTPEAEFQEILGPAEGMLFTGGHTHLQYLRRLGDSFFFNPGSVGYAYNRERSGDDFRLDPWAEYAILSVTEEYVGVEFRRVAFDVNEWVRIIRASHRPNAEVLIGCYRAAVA